MLTFMDATFAASSNFYCFSWYQISYRNFLLRLSPADSPISNEREKCLKTIKTVQKRANFWWVSKKSFGRANLRRANTSTLPFPLDRRKAWWFSGWRFLAWWFSAWRFSVLLGSIQESTKVYTDNIEQEFARQYFQLKIDLPSYISDIQFEQVVCLFATNKKQSNLRELQKNRKLSRKSGGNVKLRKKVDINWLKLPENIETQKEQKKWKFEYKRWKTAVFLERKSNEYGFQSTIEHRWAS